MLPRHRSAAITPAVVKASAGATEHLDIARVTNVVAYLGELKRNDFWVYGAAGDAAVSYRDLDYARQGRARLRRGGQRPAAAGPPRLRRPSPRSPCAAPIDSLNVSVAAALFLYEAAAARDVAGRDDSRPDDGRGGPR